MKNLNERLINEVKKNPAEIIFDYIEKTYRGTGANGGKEADDTHAVINLFDEIIYYTRDMMSSGEADKLFCKELKKIANKSLDEFDY